MFMLVKSLRSSCYESYSKILEEALIITYQSMWVLNLSQKFKSMRFINHASDYSHKSHPEENLYNKENSKKPNNLGRCLFYWYMPLTSSARSLLNCLPNIFSLHCLLALALAFHEKSNKNETKESALCLVLPFVYIFSL